MEFGIYMSRLTQGKCYDPMGSIPAGFPAAAGIGSYEEKDEIFFSPANNVPLLQINRSHQTNIPRNRVNDR